MKVQPLHVGTIVKRKLSVYSNSSLSAYSNVNDAKLMNTFLEVFVILGGLIILLLVASAIASAIFVVLSDFVRNVWERISHNSGLRDRFRENANPPSAPKERGVLRNAQR